MISGSVIVLILEFDCKSQCLRTALIEATSAFQESFCAPQGQLLCVAVPTTFVKVLTCFSEQRNKDQQDQRRTNKTVVGKKYKIVRKAIFTVPCMVKKSESATRPEVTTFNIAISVCESSGKLSP